MRHVGLAILLAVLCTSAALAARPCKLTTCDANTSTSRWASTSRSRGFPGR